MGTGPIDPIQDVPKFGSTLDKVCYLLELVVIQLQLSNGKINEHHQDGFKFSDSVKVSLK